MAIPSSIANNWGCCFHISLCGINLMHKSVAFFFVCNTISYYTLILNEEVCFTDSHNTERKSLRFGEIELNSRVWYFSSFFFKMIGVHFYFVVKGIFSKGREMERQLDEVKLVRLNDNRSHFWDLRETFVRLGLICYHLFLFLFVIFACRYQSALFMLILMLYFISC